MNLVLPPGLRHVASGLFFVAVPVLILGRTLQWVFARRRMGPIITALDGAGWLWRLSQVLHCAVGVVVGAFMLEIVFSSRLLDVAHRLGFGLLGASAFATALCALSGRSAHEGGLVVFPWVIPWTDIVEYDWWDKTKRLNLFLRTHSCQWPLGRSVYVQVASDQRNAVDTLLRQRVAPGPA